MNYKNDLNNPDLIYDADLIIVNGKVLKDRGTVEYTKPITEESLYGGQAVVPDGYERVKFEVPVKGDNYLSPFNGSIDTARWDCRGNNNKRLILRKKQSEEEKAYNGKIPAIPEGYKKTGFGFPKMGNYFLYLGGRIEYAGFDFEDEKYILLEKIKSEIEQEYGYEPKIPEGYTQVGFRAPKAGESFAIKSFLNQSKVPVAYFDYDENMKRIILTKNKKRYAVTRVELPEGFEADPKFLSRCMYGRNGGPSIEYVLSIIEE